MRYRVRFEDISLFHASFISFSRKINCRFNGIIGIIVFTDFLFDSFFTSVGWIVGEDMGYCVL